MSKRKKTAAVEPPAHLDDAGKAKWRELWPIISEREAIDQGHLDALCGYCQSWSRWTAAEAEVSRLGTVVKSPAGFPVPNPYVQISQQAQRQLRAWAAELRRK